MRLPQSLVLPPAMRWFALITLLFVGCSPAGAPAPTSPKVVPASVRDATLEASLAKIAAEADGKVAVTVLLLGTGARASVHGDVRLPLMSVFKLPLAVVALSLVEGGALALDQAVPIAEAELRPGVSPIAEAWKKGERSPTLQTLLVRVLQDSDNTAGDKLVAMQGGGAGVTARLRKLGVAGIDIAEQEIEIFARVSCPGAARPAGGWTFPAIDACPTPTPEAHLAAAQHEIDASPNGATTDALVDMLARLDRGSILNSRSRAWLHETLAGTKTGPARLKGRLPPGTRVEHKTGTGDTVEGLTIATNDVGIVTLPDGRRFAIAVLSAGSRRDQATREGVLAALAQAAWDRFAK